MNTRESVVLMTGLMQEGKGPWTRVIVPARQ